VIQVRDDFFYTSASRGRTNLRILACKTIAEFEKKYKTKQPCLHEELGIESTTADWLDGPLGATNFTLIASPLNRVFLGSVLVSYY
jgi:hypothetical protein